MGGADLFGNRIQGNHPGANFDLLRKLYPTKGCCPCGTKTVGGYRFVPGARRRLKEITFRETTVTGTQRRLAAIPLLGNVQQTYDPIPASVEILPPATSPLPLVGAVSAALCMIGCAARRYLRQLTKRASEVRHSLTKVKVEHQST